MALGSRKFLARGSPDPLLFLVNFFVRRNLSWLYWVAREGVLLVSGLVLPSGGAFFVGHLRFLSGQVVILGVRLREW